MNVVKLEFSDKAPDLVIVEMLERWLEMAKSGEILAICAVIDTANKIDFLVPTDRVKAAGYAALLQHRVLRAFLDD
jgi:hypothetical protein